MQLIPSPLTSQFLCLGAYCTPVLFSICVLLGVVEKRPYLSPTELQCCLAQNR